MHDCVIDAAIIYFANGNIIGRRPGNVFNARLTVLEKVYNGNLRLRYNNKLLREYKKLINAHRNDIIDQFFNLLDTEYVVIVKRNTLSKDNYVKAIENCKWPSHDQHLIAAAINGNKSILYVTEERLLNCKAKVSIYFSIKVVQL